MLPTSFPMWLFEQYSFEYDNRQPDFFLRIPSVGSIGIAHLDLMFWLETFILLSLQSMLNVAVAFVVYECIVLPKQRKQQEFQSYIIGYGVILPVLLVAPIYILDWLQLKNVTLMVCIVGALPNLLLLRVLEAMHDTLPSFAKESLGSFVLYYAGTLQVLLDEKTQQPMTFTRAIFMAKAKGFLTVFLQTSLLYSLLMPFDYSIAPRREILTVVDLFYWGNLVNAYLMASLTSLILEGGASGLGILTSLCTGMTMQNFSNSPMSQSSSPSDFWGNRWDRPVASGLKRGAFMPLRKFGCHRHVAAILTFVSSGFIHEYMLLLMTRRRGARYNNPRNGPYQPALGNQFVFFAWNGIVLLLERAAVDQPMIKWMKRTLPKPIRTALVLLTVLPVAHLFTDEYVNSSFYGDAAFAFPRISFARTTPSIE